MPSSFNHNQPVVKKNCYETFNESEQLNSYDLKELQESVRLPALKKYEDISMEDEYQSEVRETLSIRNLGENIKLRLDRVKRI